MPSPACRGSSTHSSLPSTIRPRFAPTGRPLSITGSLLLTSLATRLSRSWPRRLLPFIPRRNPSMGQPDGSSPLPAPLADAIALVTRDRDHGASWLARQAAQALADASHAETAGEPAEQHLLRIHQAAQAFADARPSMAALANTAARIWWAGAPSAAPIPDPQARLVRLHDE